MSPTGPVSAGGTSPGAPRETATSRPAARDELAELARAGLTWPLDSSGRGSSGAGARRAAVLVLFGRLDDLPATASGPVAADLDVLLQRRSEAIAHHPGQISFPGGGIESGETAVAAALREAVEETGLDPTGVDVLGSLPELPVPVSNNRVTPVLAWWTRPSAVAAVDHAETVDVFRVPVADLLEPANRVVVEHRFAGGVARTPAFEVAGVLVWGFTAIVLDRLFDAVGWTVPFASGRIVVPH